MSERWYEVWADETHKVPYLLMLRPSDRGFEVLEPSQENRRVFFASTYDEARLWLLEDEFELVGRKEIE